MATVAPYTRANCGEGGIRTLDTVARMPVFKTGAFNHSATSPVYVYMIPYILKNHENC